MSLRGFVGRRGMSATLAALTLLVGVVLAGPAASPAHASVYYNDLKNAVTGWCLDDSNTPSNKDLLRTIPCNHSNYQQWSQGANNNILKNLATKRCLDWSRDYGLRAFPCGSETSPSVYQTWHSYVTYSTVPAHLHFRGGENNGCIDDNKTDNLRYLTCYGNEYQAWLPRSD